MRAHPPQEPRKQRQSKQNHPETTLMPIQLPPSHTATAAARGAAGEAPSPHPDRGAPLAPPRHPSVPESSLAGVSAPLGSRLARPVLRVLYWALTRTRTSSHLCGERKSITDVPSSPLHSAVGLRYLILRHYPRPGSAASAPDLRHVRRPTRVSSPTSTTTVSVLPSPLPPLVRDWWRGKDPGQRVGQ